MRERATGSVRVYSTDAGRICPGCGAAVAACRCRAVQAAPPPPGRTRVALESKGRGGKSVTVVRGLPMAPDALQELARALRTACGCGGSVKDGVLEVQGDQRARVEAFLMQRGLLSAAGRTAAHRKS